MKKRFAVLLLTLFLTVSAGCSFASSHMIEPVNFYYRRTQFLYGSSDSVIGSESREASGHTEDLNYLLSLYLAGPVEEGLISPFSRGTLLLSVVQWNDSVTIEVSDTGRFLSDANFSLACACISKTCMELTGAESVTVISGSRSLTTTPNNILLADECAPEQSIDDGGQS